MALKRTPLYPMHVKYKGKIIDFGGWELPVQYEGMGIIKEHQMVREKAGLFDVSHMGEITIKGPEAEDFIQKLVTNNIKTISESQIMYSPMCYPDGGVVDDLLIYKYSTIDYLLVVNASNADKDFAWIKENVIDGIEIANVSDQFAQLAIQGPMAQEILQKIADVDLSTIKFFWFNPTVKIAGAECIVSRTGYTGEDGFEIYLKPDKAINVWEAILTAGGDNISPIGLGARDSLRFEAKLPLYGQEIDKDITPLEAKLGFFVKLDNDDFIGKSVLVKQKEDGLARVQVEFELVGKGIPRPHYEVQKDGVNIGVVTTGMQAPFLKKNIGLALIKKEYANPEEEIDIIIRNKPVKAVVSKGIFYKKNTKKK
ncbi:MAG: glycine cleavage system aminomethyltransferase GcvT [Syntrophomonadaceae bacterium]|nr:glycine cleavage system aminomethyltransferase GcvT [Syntrophomonadaceae bacterium]